MRTRRTIKSRPNKRPNTRRGNSINGGPVSRSCRGTANKSSSKTFNVKLQSKKLSTFLRKHKQEKHPRITAISGGSAKMETFTQKLLEQSTKEGVIDFLDMTLNALDRKKGNLKASDPAIAEYNDDQPTTSAKAKAAMQLKEIEEAIASELANKPPLKRLCVHFESPSKPQMLTRRLLNSIIKGEDSTSSEDDQSDEIFLRKQEMEENPRITAITGGSDKMEALMKKLLEQTTKESLSDFLEMTLNALDRMKGYLKASDPAIAEDNDDQPTTSAKARAAMQLKEINQTLASEFGNKPPRLYVHFESRAKPEVLTRSLVNSIKKRENSTPSEYDESDEDSY